ncbi:MAG: CDP-archaeol synthase [Gammaproteobacteria bacterium]|nr:CDP-archaeol synthase [Gammaproteobacteria bacterium]
MDTLNSLILILVANGAPVFASYLFSHRQSLPVDLYYRLRDQQYLFGETKTWRGLFASLVMTSVLSLFLGYSVYFGLMIAALSMAGDLLSSFIKRRLKKPSSSQFLLLDQVPESLLPAMFCMLVYDLELIQVIGIIVIFIIIEMALSIVLFRFGVRKKPY